MKAPPTAMNALPTITAPVRTASTLMPCASTATGFSPAMRTARPDGVRNRTYQTERHAQQRQIGEWRLVEQRFADPGQVRQPGIDML